MAARKKTPGGKKKAARAGSRAPDAAATKATTRKKKKAAGARARKSTRTSAFGVSGRISHDSSTFYDSKLYAGAGPRPGEPLVENQAPEEALDRIYCKSAEAMDDLPDGCVHLMVTSPPYNVQKEYDDDLGLREYLDLLKRVFAETYRVLAPGGRVAINVANLGRKPYIPLHAYIIQDMHELGFQMRGEVIWNKGASAGPSCAWGSWRSASNPVLRDVHEYILIFCKGSFKRPKGADQENTIGRDEFLENTKSVWTFPPVSAKRVGHPAPFPEELPARLIELYTYAGDVVLDPFNGSGSTCLAAARRGRRYVGYDLDPEYVELAERRLAELADSGDAA